MNDQEYDDLLRSMSIDSPSYDFGDIDLGGLDLGGLDLGNMDFGSNFDLGSFDDIAAVDLGNLDLGDIDLGNLDLGDIDVGSLDLGDIDFGSNFDLGSFEDLAAVADLGGLSNIDLTQGANLGGLGLTPTGRGQMSIRDPDTGATGLTAEGFTSLKDLLGSGTAEEIARYTPGTADYSLRSGLETPDGLGLSSDATRGMGLEYMGGGQGLSLYKPAEYGGSILEDLVARNPGQFSGIEDYLNNEIFGGKGLTPFKGTGGTLSQAGFLNQSSDANPLGAKYSLGDPKSFINRPSITGQQATVSPGRTVIDNKNGTFNVVTEGGGKTTTKTVDSNGTVLKTTTTDTTTGDKTTTTGGGSTTTTTPRTTTKPTSTTKNQAGLGALLPLLLALLAMNKGGGGGGGGKGAVIPGLTATQRQTPYAQQQRAPGYRPGQGGVNYFEQTQFTPRMAAGGGIGGLLNGPGDGVSDSIPAVIDGGMAGGGQPAKVARGEYIMDARTVAALGNGSTDAGAERLDKMRENILRDDRQTGVGEDSKAYRHLMA
jgi:hypothetical protein